MNIYVGNLSLDATAKELWQMFMPFGEVTAVTLMNDKHIGSGQSRGYGFVEMSSSIEAHAAIDGLQGLTLKGRVLQLVKARPLSKRALYRSQLAKRGFGSHEKIRERDH